MLHLQDDELNRKEFLNSLFLIFDNFANQGENGLTILLNGKYGSGKSTLLNFIKEKNLNDKKYSIVEYNAWENNIFDNPLIPILNEINDLNSNANKIKETAIHVIKSLPKVFFATLANVHGVDLNAMINKIDFFAEYKEYKQALNNYREVLCRYCKTNKVLFLVDELDRCLPEYQIKVLENIYHLLNIPNLIVLIALDRNQLDASIKNHFGENNNVFGYLLKFIDYQVDLPDDYNSSLILSLMKFNCENYDLNTKEIIINMFKQMGYPSGSSIRDAKFIINEVNIVCNSINKNKSSAVCDDWMPVLVSFILITKYNYPIIYKKWFYEEKRFNAFNIVKSTLSESKFGEFLEDIKNTHLSLIIDDFKNDNNLKVGKAFLVYFISVFTPRTYIHINEIEKFVGLSNDEINCINTDYKFYSKVNEIIRKVKILI